MLTYAGGWGRRERGLLKGESQTRASRGWGGGGHALVGGGEEHTLVGGPRGSRVALVVYEWPAMRYSIYLLY